MAADASSIAQSLVARFSRMVRSDGGSVSLLGVEGDLVRIGYKPGVDPECPDGVCVLPEAELQAMMAEVLAAQDPSLRVVVKRTAD
jgi:hypothetical protein